MSLRVVISVIVGVILFGTIVSYVLISHGGDDQPKRISRTEVPAR
jgi:hypothetical protein